MIKYKKKVTFLFDKENYWIKKFFTLNFFKKFKNYNFKFSNEIKKIKNQDIVFIIGQTKILDSRFLDSNKMNIVIHESNLPKGKGFAPVQWQILEGKNEIPICALEASNKFDSGRILIKDKFTLNGTELYDEIRDKQAKATLKLIQKILNLHPKLLYKKQNGKETFYKKRNPKDSEININQSIKKQFNLLRVGNNESWPSYFQYKGIKYLLKIYKDS
jgi:methionyl-tRNA formyltransferase